MKKNTGYQKTLARLSAWFVALLVVVAVSCDDDNDDTAAVSAGFTVSSQTILETASSASVTVGLSAPAPQNGKVMFTITPDKATYGTDYVTKPATTDNKITMAVAKGQTAVQFNILPVNNSLLNGDRTLNVTVSDAEGGIMVGEKKSLTVVLADDEGPSKANFAVGEGRLVQAESEGREVEILLSSPTLVAGILNVSISGADATYGESYVTDPAATSNVITLSVPAGAESASFKVLPVTIEEIADVTFTLSGAEGGVAVGTASTYVLTVDPAPVVLQVSPTSALVFGSVDRGAEAAVQHYTVSGANLTEDVTVTAPRYYTLSLLETGTYTSTISIPKESINSGDITVYVKFTAGSVNNLTFAGAITHSSTEKTATVNVTGTQTGSPLLAESFNYTGTDASDIGTVSSGDWEKHSGTQLPFFSTTGLTYSGYPGSGVGGAMSFTSGASGVNDADVHMYFDPVTTTSDIYVSFLVQISAAKAADYFFHLGPNPIGSTFKARVYAKSTGAGWSIGIAKSTTTNDQIIDTQELAFNQTYLVVIKYAYNTTTTSDDQVSLYVYESGIPATEPGTPKVTLGPTGNTATGDVAIGAVAVRQGSTTPTGKIDGIRVALSWDDLFDL